jgi:hypothetical protein
MPDLLAVSSARRVRFERAELWSIPGRSEAVMPILTLVPRCAHNVVVLATDLPTKRERGRLGAHCQEP